MRGWIAFWTGMADASRAFAKAFHSIARPYLTVMIATLYNAVCAWGVIYGHLEWKEYIMAMGPVNSTIIAFWFAERAALKNPAAGDQEDKS